MKLNLKKQKGITLIALVITIVVLIILATLTINIVINGGLFQVAKEAKKFQANAIVYDYEKIDEAAELIDELTGKTNLSPEKIAAVNNKVKETTGTLQEVAYEAKVIEDETYVEGKGRKITVEGAYSGAGTDQEFYQSEVGAIGTNKVKWNVLYADENGVNLVSQPTKKGVQFKNSSGYDNCLYYLNELSKLFANEDKGVTFDRVHALNLTDIKKVAEMANVGNKVIDNEVERDWNWDLDVIRASSTNVYNNGNVGKKTESYTNTSYTYYPGLYTADASREVTTNNPMYDETPGSKITTDSGIQRPLEDESNPASKLTVNYTYFDTSNNETTLTRLGKFGESNIGQELFKSGTSYWLASRCIKPDTSYAFYHLREVFSGYIYYNNMCRSSGNTFGNTLAFRVVVSVPSSHVNIANDGTVTLK